MSVDSTKVDKQNRFESSSNTDNSKHLGSGNNSTVVGGLEEDAGDRNVQGTLVMV